MYVPGSLLFCKNQKEKESTEIHTASRAKWAAFIFKCLSLSLLCLHNVLTANQTQQRNGHICGCR